MTVTVRFTYASTGSTDATNPIMRSPSTSLAQLVTAGSSVWIAASDGEVTIDDVTYTLYKADGVTPLSGYDYGLLAFDISELTTDATIEGGAGSASITSGSGSDSLDGAANGGTIQGGAGEDTIYCYSSADLIHGDGDNDDITAGSGDNTVYGGDGNDTISSSEGNDSLFGGAGNDRITSGRTSSDDATDVIHGDDGNDTLYPGRGDDFIYGDAGDDEIGICPDNLIAGTDSDNSYSGKTIDGGAGNDLLFLYGTRNDTSATFDLTGSAISDVETIAVSFANGPASLSLDDTAVASGAVMTIDAALGNYGLSFDGNEEWDGSFIFTWSTGTGNDAITGGWNSDTIYGSLGADTLDGYYGTDLISGTAAQLDGDTITLTAGDRIVVTGEDLSALNGTAMASGALSLNNGRSVNLALSAVGGTWSAAYDGTATTLTVPAPALLSSSPDDDGTAVAVGSDITLTFDQPVIAGTGAIYLMHFNGAFGEVVEQFDVATGLGSSGGTVTFLGSTVTVNLGVDLAGSTEYYLTVASTAVSNIGGTACFPGLHNPTSLNFTTEAVAVVSSGGGGYDGGSGGGSSSGIDSAPLSDGEKDAANDAFDAFKDSLPEGTTVTTETRTPGSGDIVDGVVTITGGDGTEAMVIDVSNLPPGTIIKLDNVEFAVIVGGVSINGGAGSNYVVADGSAQYIVLGPDDDTLIGGAGNDTIGSTSGNDVVMGGADADSVFGGLDNDSVYGNGGADRVYGNEGGDSLYGGADSDYVFGGGDNDRVFGDKGDDAVYGNAGYDVVYGNAGNDWLFGGQDADVLFGGQGKDVVAGDAGDDWLSGDTGADTLTGGGGSDRFYFSKTGLGPDVITDFTSGSDMIVVSSPNFGSLPAGVLDSRYFALSGAETADSRFVFNSATGALSYDADGSGALAGTTIAMLGGGKSLAAGDILVLAG